MLSTHHGEEDAKFWIHVHIVSISEYKVFAPLLFAGEDNRNLLCSDRQNRKVDAVELVETAPGARLSETWTHSQSLYRY